MIHTVISSNQQNIQTTDDSTKEKAKVWGRYAIQIAKENEKMKVLVDLYKRMCDQQNIIGANSLHDEIEAQSSRIEKILQNFEKSVGVKDLANNPNVGSQTSVDEALAKLVHECLNLGIDAKELV